MKKSALWKDTFREIKHSKSRFLSIFAIILLGVAFYAGISATGPDMIDTADTYFNEYRLMDNRVLSTMGLDEEDIELLEDIPGASVQSHYTQDVVLEETGTVLKLMSYGGEGSQQINQYEVAEGRLPEQSGEVALDNVPEMREAYAVGDTIAVETEEASGDPSENLETTEFEVVGFVNTPLFIETTSRGSTNIGSGSLDGFGVIPEEDFSMEVKTEAYIVFDDAESQTAYTEAYKETIEEKTGKLEQTVAHRPEERQEEIRAEAEEEIESGEQELEDARQELENAETELAEARQELDDGWQAYEDGRKELESQTQNAREEIARQREQLEQAQEELNERRAQAEAGQQELANQRANLEEQKEQLRAAEEGLALIRSAEQQLAEGEQQIAQQRAELEEARSQLIQARDGLEQIRAAENQLAAAQEEINEGRAQLDEQRQQLDGLTEAAIQNGLAQIEEGIAQLRTAQEGLQQLEAAQQALDAAQQTLDQERTAFEQWSQQEGVTPEEIAAAEAQLDAAQSELDQQQAALEEQREQFGRLTEADIQAQLAELETQRSELQAAQEGLQQLQQAEAQLDAAQAEVDNGRAALEEQRTQLQGLTMEEVEANLAELASGMEQLEAAEQELADQRARLEQERAQLQGLDEEGIQEAWAQIEAGEAQMAEAEAELASGLEQLDAAQSELDSGLAQLREGEQTLEEETAAAQEELADARQELEQGEADYEEGRAEFEEQRAEAETELAQAEEDLAEAREQLDDLPLPEYFVLDRTDNPGYSEFEDNADRIASIARIFPVFFLLLAALISLTTMTRMVDEGRSHIGTMKALGYKNREIMTKYMVYAMAATVLGAGIGLLLGYYLFPAVIFDAFGSLYNMPPIEINHFWTYTLISIAGAILATGGATWFAVRSTLESNAATLLRPKAPKKGKRILLEKIPFIWDRFSFNQKVSARNLFRYKRRMLMTIVGVSGSTALILTGFGLLDSISDVADLQFGKINQYQSIVALNPDADEDDVASYEELLASSGVENTLSVQQESMTGEEEGANSQDVTLFVPESPADLPDFVSLVDYETDEAYDLPEDGVLATQKLVELFDLEVGDEVTVVNADNEEVSFPVRGIVENYLGHTLYMTPEVYEQATGSEPEANTQLLTFDVGSVDEDRLGNELTSESAVAGVTFVTNVESAFQSTLDSLDVVMIVLIVSAAALAFIVLYNLTNINVSERIRELSTIKVLGFYDKEVTMYIYRENLVLTLMGIAAGLLLGLLLHQFVIQTAEQDTMMFSRIVNPSSHLYSGLLTFLFAGIVMIVMHFKLKHVDMVEALKTTD